MEAYEYETMYHFETTYWWYRALHGALADQLRRLRLPPGAQVLDAGCGTGQNLVNIERMITPHGFGFDYSPHAMPFLQKRGLTRICRASINEIPFRAESFDAVVSVDVLESDAVDDEQAVRELWRVTKRGGYLLLVVPAYRWLMTEEHHKAVHASRRYSRLAVARLLQRQPVRLLRVTHYFASLFPAVAAYRLALRYRPTPPTGSQPRSELKPLASPINELLAGVMQIERHAVAAVDLPFGSSIMAVAQKGT